MHLEIIDLFTLRFAAQPPPSYSALAGETVNVGDRDMTNATGDNFKPQYTYYDWKQTAPN